MKPIIVANWKANVHLEILDDLRVDTDVMDVALAPPSVYYDHVKKRTKGNLILCAQDCSRFNCGSYTGETPAVFLKNVGVEYVIIGHCDRRKYFNEDNTVLALKVQNALECKLKVVYCIGESREDREAGNHINILYNQFFSTIGKDITIDVAYEPVWSIGTGILPTPEEVQDVFKNIRKWADSINVKCRILYGGSVKLSTINDFKHIEGLDGFLIGALSLTNDFQRFLNEYKNSISHKSKP